jgi:hypothetical protein
MHQPSAVILMTLVSQRAPSSPSLRAPTQSHALWHGRCLRLAEFHRLHDTMLCWPQWTVRCRRAHDGPRDAAGLQTAALRFRFVLASALLACWTRSRTRSARRTERCCSWVLMSGRGPVDAALVPSASLGSSNNLVPTREKLNAA